MSSELNSEVVKVDVKGRTRLRRATLGTLVIAVSSLLVTGCSVLPSPSSTSSTTPAPTGWFAGYADVIAEPAYSFELRPSAATEKVVLSFIVGNSDRPCVPLWGNEYTLSQADESLDLSHRVALLREQGGDVAVAFGGWAHEELSSTCLSGEELVGAYRSVIDELDLNIIEFDLEGSDLKFDDSGIRRAEAIAQVQADLASEGRTLAVWLTLAGTPDGLSTQAINAATQFLSAGVNLAGVNVMTMNFPRGTVKNLSMSEAAIGTLTAAEPQVAELYSFAGIQLSTEEVWQKMGATPMIGQNDVQAQVFTLEDAQKLNRFAREHNLGRMSMWSLSRDAACDESFTLPAMASYRCSGVVEAPGDFAAALSIGLTANW